MKKGDVIRQKCVNTTFYLTGILAHKVNNILSNIRKITYYSILLNHVKVYNNIFAFFLMKICTFFILARSFIAHNC